MIPLPINRVLVKLSDIKPYDNNPRDCTPEAIAAMVHSIQRYRYTNPIIVDVNYVIICGHKRYFALCQLHKETGAYETVTVSYRNDLNPTQVKQLRLKEQATADLSSWNEGNLVSEMREVHDITALKQHFPGVDLSIKLGSFSAPAPVTPSQVSGATSDAEGRFTAKSQENASKMVEIICHGCGQTFLVDREEVARRTEMKRVEPSA